jgi:hypothetical protein
MKCNNTNYFCENQIKMGLFLKKVGSAGYQMKNDIILRMNKAVRMIFIINNYP